VRRDGRRAQRRGGRSRARDGRSRCGRTLRLARARRRTAARAHRIARGGRDGCRDSDGRIHDRSERGGTREHAGRTRRRRVRGVSGRNARPVPPALSLPVRQLHALRAAPLDRDAIAVRSREYVDGRLRSLRRVRGRICGPGGSSLPRAADRLSPLRTACETRTDGRQGRHVRHAFDARRRGCGAKPAPKRRDRRDQGNRRVPPRVRCDESEGGRNPARAQGPRGQTVRADGVRRRNDSTLLQRRRDRRRVARVVRSPDRAPARRRTGTSAGGDRARDARARLHVAAHAAARLAAPPDGPARRDDERQSFERTAGDAERRRPRATRDDRGLHALERS
jgi:hypothetical protein